MSSEMAKVKARAASARSRAAATEQMIVSKIVKYGASTGLGFAEAKGMPMRVAGVPTKLGIGLLATLGEIFMSGASRRLCSAISDASLCAYGYNAGRLQSFVAGEDDYVSGIESVSGGEL